MATHSASVTVGAPADQVWKMWSHFNDYPKFMSYVKEVTYYDEQRSHWVVDIVGRHEWDAVNEGWAEGRQIGWRSTDGLVNNGRVTFEPQGSGSTLLNVTVNYDPPAGFLGDIGEALGAGKQFEQALQRDLNHFAAMVAQAPAGALDPMSSNYLFHADSAAARGETTTAQDESMGRDTSPGPVAGGDYAQTAVAGTGGVPGPVGAGASTATSGTMPGQAAQPTAAYGGGMGAASEMSTGAAGEGSGIYVEREETIIADDTDDDATRIP